MKIAIEVNGTTQGAEVRSEELVEKLIEHGSSIENIAELVVCMCFYAMRNHYFPGQESRTSRITKT